MGTYSFGVREAYIATWNGVGSYGTLTQIDAIQMVSIDDETVSAILEGNDLQLASHAVSVGANIELRFAPGEQTMEIFSIFTGRQILDYTTYRRLMFGGDYPYIGFVAQVYDSGGTGSKVLRVPRMKAQDGISFDAEYGGFTINNANFTVTVPPDQTDVWWLEEWDTAVTPLTSILG